ncbi:MAG: ornithine carbamoyltransferase [Paenibacillaceae bacterium]|nr:ornithine carbamoyltransferase [Paenibacillaceae bacterium]
MHLLDIAELDESTILDIFKRADSLRLEPEAPLLAGKTCAIFFPEASIRTRLTFEKGIQLLGGRTILFPPEALDKEERLQDVMGYLENWADAAIVRHSKLDKLRELAAHARIPVINAMTAHNHPCEILADLYALRLRRPDYRDLTYTFVGPPGNIARTWMHVAEVLRLRFIHVCTPGHEMSTDNAHYRFSVSLEETLGESDVILTDSLPRPFREEVYLRDYCITPERMGLAKPGAVLNPCPPFRVGEEVSSSVIGSPYFVGYGFKRHLLEVQQAVLLHCLER